MRYKATFEIEFSKKCKENAIKYSREILWVLKQALEGRSLKLKSIRKVKPCKAN